MEDYKYKYIKYKTKYLKLVEESKKKVNMKGGMSPDEFLQFKNELIEIYKTVYSAENSICISGSSVIAYLLNRLGLYEQLSQMVLPGDVDIMYIGKDNMSKNIGMYYPKQNTPQRSRTFELRPEMAAGRILKSFDLTNLGSVRLPSFTLTDTDINGKQIQLNFLNLKILQSYYKEEVLDLQDEPTDPQYIRKKARLDLINLIIRTIESNHLLHEYGLDPNVTKREKTKSRFDDSNDIFGNITSFGSLSPPSKSFKSMSSNSASGDTFRGSLFDSPINNNSAFRGSIFDSPINNNNSVNSNMNFNPNPFAGFDTPQSTPPASPVRKNTGK